MCEQMVMVNGIELGEIEGRAGRRRAAGKR